MLRRILIALTMLTSLTLAGGHALAADPTMHEVYQAAEAGDYKQAQAMMDQVLRDHPNSAKAHFVEAELLAKQGRVSEAQSELSTAESLDPSRKFATPEALQKLNVRLAPAYTVHQPAAAVPAAAGGFHWGPLLLLVGMVALVVLAIRAFRSRPRYAPQGQAPGYGGGAAAAQPYGVGGVGPVQPAGGMGSGILGGLATGAAVGAGVVAGEALMHRVLDGGHRSDDGQTGLANADIGAMPSMGEPQYDMGGDDFGVNDSSSWDDNSGGGGDDWN